MPTTPGGVPRVLFVTNNLGGGTGTHVVSLVEHWPEPSSSPLILCQGPVATKVPPAIAIEPGPDRPWYDRFPLAQLRRLRQVRRIYRTTGAQILHCYFFWPVLFGRVLKFLRLVPTLIENREDLGFNTGRTVNLILRLTRHLPDRVICVSDAVRNAVVAREGIDPSRTVVIRNGVTLPSEARDHRGRIRREIGIAEDIPVVGMVANLNRTVKGIAYFLDAIPLIVDEVPTVRFIIIGEGPDESALRAQAARLGIASQVSFVGFKEDVGPWYQAMDISVLTSLSEGLSITLLESMSHGLPVVVTRVGGNPEVVADGENGYLVSAKDIPAFAERVVRLLRDAELRTRMGRCSRRIIQDQFDIKAVTSRYVRVYREARARSETHAKADSDAVHHHVRSS